MWRAAVAEDNFAEDGHRRKRSPRGMTVRAGLSDEFAATRQRQRLPIDVTVFGVAQRCVMPIRPYPPGAGERRGSRVLAPFGAVDRQSSLERHAEGQGLPAGRGRSAGCDHWTVNWVVRGPHAALARDGGLALVLAVVGVGTADAVVPAVLAVGAALPLMARRVYPLPVALVAVGVTAAYLLRGYPYGFILVSFAVAV
jgi:hypothetical protein